MKDRFPGHYRPTDTEFSQLWSSCLFVPDTNVLLDLYRYNQTTREGLLGIMEAVKDRLWVPFQVAIEYQERRLDVIRGQRLAYDDIRSALEDGVNKIKGEISKYSKHPVVNTQSLIRRLERARKQIERDLKVLEAQHPEYSDVEPGGNDPVRVHLDALLSGKVGQKPAQKELQEIYQEGASRYAKRVPPGYEDQKKPDDSKYGDLVIWKQTLQKAKESKQPILFITNDTKEDWWRIMDGKTIGPQPALINEMMEVASVSCYLYSADQFMEYARQFLNQEVDQAAIDEVREVSARPVPDYTIGYTTGNAAYVDNPLFSTWLPNSDGSGTYKARYRFTDTLDMGTLLRLGSGPQLLDAHGNPIRRLSYVLGSGHFGDPASGYVFEPLPVYGFNIQQSPPNAVEIEDNKPEEPKKEE